VYMQKNCTKLCACVGGVQPQRGANSTERGSAELGRATTPLGGLNGGS
jgi:hypothetical protein